MTAHPFSLTAPAVMTLQPDAAGTFKVINTGTKALTVHETLGRTSVKALHYPASSHATMTAMGQPWIAVTPHSFTLQPGQSETVHIADKVPPGVQGNHYLQVVWTAQPAHQAAGGLHLAGGVATSVMIALPGKAVPVTTQPLPHAPLVPPSGGPGPAVLGGGILAALLAVLAVILIVARARRHRAATA